MIKNENELSDFLIKDLEFEKKEKDNISNFINELGGKLFQHNKKINTFY